MDKDHIDNQKTLTRHIDNSVSKLLSDYGSRSSRRSFITKLGKFVVGLAGMSLLDSLPADRRVAFANFPVNNCDRWSWCGMNGYPCARCGGTDTTCPSSGCSTTGNPWSACCVTGSGCYRVYYYDCCATSGKSCPSVTCTASCHNKALGGWWCNGGDSSNYRCTLAIVGSSCSFPC